MRRHTLVLLVLAAAVTMLAAAAVHDASGSADAAPVVEPRDLTVLSPTYTVERKYRSMTGPFSQQELSLEGEASGLQWITGYRAVMVGKDGVTPMAQDFMCHSNLDLDLEAHREALGPSPGFNSRLFTLSQGQLEVAFPPGFGIPVLASEALSLTTQVLNLNVEGETFEVRHRVSVEYVSEQEIQGEMKALMPISAYGLALIDGEDGYFGMANPDSEKHGPGCLTGETASDHSYEDGLGRVFSGHWVVPPGRQENRTLVTRLMQVPYDTTIHYIAVHLHPFAESLELRDLTAGETVFASSARNFSDRIGLAHVDHFTSAEGVPVFADHDYELVSIYDNDTAEPQDSMAVMYIYIRDLDFERRHSARDRRKLG